MLLDKTKTLAFSNIYHTATKLHKYKGRSMTFGRGKKGADNKSAEQKGRREKGTEQKGTEQKCTEQKLCRTKRARDHDVASPLHSRLSFLPIIVFSLNLFFFFFFCRNIIHSLRLHCLKYVSIKSLKTEESYNTKL